MRNPLCFLNILGMIVCGTLGILAFNSGNYGIALMDLGLVILNALMVF